jgi:hypothetical protein
MMARDFGFGLDSLRAFTDNGLQAAWIDADAPHLAARAPGRVRCAARAARSRQPLIQDPRPTRPFSHHEQTSLPRQRRAGCPLRLRPGGMAHGQAHQHHRPLWRRRRVDSTARLLADKLGERLKQSVVVDNVTGAGGTIGLAKGAQAAPDGYTLVMGADSPVAIAPYANPKAVRYDVARDLAPIGLVNTAPMVLVARKDLPANNLAELVQLAKEPGKLSYATSGVGTVLHLAMELIKQQGQFFATRALSRRRADRRRRDRRPGGPGHAGQRLGRALRAEWQAQGHRRHRRQAPGHPARRARRGRDARLQGL